MPRCGTASASICHCQRHYEPALTARPKTLVIVSGFAMTGIGAEETFINHLMQTASYFGLGY
jgi:hypothetical protein